VIRALIILECVLLIIVALDRVVRVPVPGGTVERPGREQELGRDGQVASIRAAIVPSAASKPDVPQPITLNETAHSMPSITPAESSIVSTALSQRPLPAAVSR
jgi:hypothetical protein